MIKDILKFILFLLIKIIPKDKNLLVFGDRAGLRFADNSRHLFLFLNKNYKDFKCVWISKNYEIIKYLNKKKYLCFHCYSLNGLYYSLIANWHIYNFVENDINPIISNFSNSILLWHGTLPKKLEEIKVENSFISKLINKNIKKYFIYTNKLMASNILDRFPKNKYNLIISDLPRNLILQKKYKKNLQSLITDNEKKFIKKIKSQNKVIFGYFPTWRKNGLELFCDVKKLEDLKKINKILIKYNSIILIKKHMNSEKKDNNTHYNKEIENIASYLETLESFKFVDYDFDLNSVLECCDVLISDYSGVIFDFLYLNRPIIIYAPDYNEFLKYNGFMFDPIKENFAYKAQNLEQLKKIIKNYCQNQILFQKRFKNERNAIKNLIFTKQNKIKEILDLLKN